MRKILAILSFFTMSAMAQDGEVFIRNICDTLTTSDNPKVELKLSSIDEFYWRGNLHTMKADTVKQNHHASYTTLQPIVKNLAYDIPLSITAECRETKSNDYSFAKWVNKNWVEDITENYATYIYDIHQLRFADFDSTNSYNVFVMDKRNSIPKDESFMAGNIAVSKTFEFQFEWWISSVEARNTVTTEEKKGDSVIAVAATQITYGSGISYDSINAVKSAIQSIKQETLQNVTDFRVQTLKIVLSDPNKNIESSSSSSPEAKSSSSKEEPKSSSSVGGKSSSSGGDKSSSSVGGKSSSSGEAKSSSSKVEPKSSSSKGDSKSSSSKTERLVDVFASSPAWNEESVEVRRLDGTVVKNARLLPPGIYYVKNASGVWNKKVVLPR
ncbi:MAG: hypothetical protein HUK21_06650 [Fibrobacteraceae bacterium]|nr:hypothetical protein [Fibrobacteraceae bacterium]